MALIAAWSNFLGANLQVHPKRLGEGLGVVAENMRLSSADLRPWKAPATVISAAWPLTLTSENFRTSGLRGVNGYVSNGFSIPDLTYVDQLQAWGVNIARVWVPATWNGTAYVVASGALDNMDLHLAQLSARQIYAVIVVGVPTADMPWTTERRAAFVALWTALATRWNGNRVIAGFDLMNEPNVYNESTAVGADYEALYLDWPATALACITAIRAVDPQRVIVYEPATVAAPSQLAGIPSSILGLSNVVYSPHLYDPFALTHDGVGAFIAGTTITPTLTFDSAAQAALTAAIAQIIAFKAAGRAILVGEFSCVRWGLNASQWIDAAIEQMEAAGLPWCYHEFRAASVWDAEAPNGTNPSYTRSDDAPVATLLRAAFDLNAPASTTGSSALISMYRTNRAVPNDTEYWWQWTTDVDVARSLISDDPTEEIYYTGDGAPKLTDNLIGLPPSPGPASARTLGIPFPPTQMGVPVVNTEGDGENETRAYVDTFINDKNRESAPGVARVIVCKAGSTVDLSGFSIVPSGNHGIDRRAIYVSTDGSDYQLVIEQAATLTTALDNLARGRVLQTGGDESKPAHLPPPDNLKGLIPLWNGMYGGFFGKTVAACVPGRPWAWPVEYQDTLHDDIVGTGVWGQNWLILTTSTPVILRGGPLLFDRTPVEFQQACVSKRSIVSLGHGVVYASPNGLCYVGNSGPRIITDGILLPEQWQALVPSTIIGTRVERWYVGFYNDGISAKGFMIDPVNPDGIVFLSFGARGRYYDPISDRLYLQDTGNTIKRWNHGATLTATFKTSIKRHSEPTNPGFGMVIADEPETVGWELWAEVLQPGGGRVWTLVDSRSVTTGEPFALPGGYIAQDFQVQISSSGPVQGVMLAEEVEDLV